jgi:DNA-binding response OmpR family regulator
MTSSARPPGHTAPPAAAGTSVLVVEDDLGLATQLVRGLSRGGYTVDHVTTGREALDRANPNVVLLDLGLPDGDGVDICRQLRKRSRVAIIVVTARGEEPERVLALDAGADDYLVKPFDFAELLARLRALQRRSPALQSPRLAIGSLEFDPASREVRIGPARPRLTGTELSILEILMRRSPAVVPRQSIALHVWAEEADALGSNTIDVHMARLRAKLALAPVQVETIRGIGYRLVPV